MTNFWFNHGLNYCTLFVGDVLTGTCDFYTNYQNETIYIISLNVIEQNKGYGTILMHMVLQKAYDNGIYYVELADVSDRYRKPHNIYTKIGLHYSSANDNDMKGNLRHILYGKKYIDNY